MILEVGASCFANDQPWSKVGKRQYGAADRSLGYGAEDHETEIGGCPQSRLLFGQWLGQQV